MPNSLNIHHATKPQKEGIRPGSTALATTELDFRYTLSSALMLTIYMNFHSAPHTFQECQDIYQNKALARLKKPVIFSVEIAKLNKSVFRSVGLNRESVRSNF